MINFPVFQHLKIENYGMYPGTESSPGINFEFQKGPTLILGINGLGKTTLITILLRLLTGPYDLPARASYGKLGYGRLKPVKIDSFRTLGNRVADGAKASLKCRQFWKARVEAPLFVPKYGTCLSFVHFSKLTYI